MDQIACCIRRSLVKNSPEERVRQAVLLSLLHSGGWPKHHIIVEAALDTFSHTPVKRRVDIMCFGPGCQPLMIIECKAAPVDASAYRQIHGYNLFVQAPVVALSWPGVIVLSHGPTIIYQGSNDGMPSYQQLQQLMRSL